MANCPFDRDRPLGDPSHRQDGGLRRIQDRLEAVDPVHAQVGQREGAAGQIVGRQLAALALSTNAALSAAMCASGLRSTSRRTGTTSPASVATAMPTVDALAVDPDPLRRPQNALARGCSASAAPAMRASRSVTRQPDAGAWRSMIGQQAAVQVEQRLCHHLDAQVEVRCTPEAGRHPLGGDALARLSAFPSARLAVRDSRRRFEVLRLSATREHVPSRSPARAARCRGARASPAPGARACLPSARRRKDARATGGRCRPRA